MSALRRDKKRKRKIIPSKAGSNEKVTVKHAVFFTVALKNFEV